MSETLKRVLDKAEGVRGPTVAGDYMAKCPCHDDRSRSLCVDERWSFKYHQRRVFLHCMAGCPTGAIMDALGLKDEDMNVE